jgi:hypothetical protein
LEELHEHVNFALITTVHDPIDPQNYEEAKWQLKWERAMKPEYSALMKNNTWALEELPLGKIPIGCKRVFKTKYKVHGSLAKYKAWLVEE